MAFFFARIFGIVSPKMMTSTVRISVASHDQFSFPASVNASTDATDDAPMFTRLLPIRIAERALSNRSTIL